ncbi:hypothetical protein [Pseudoalteromonas sp. MMG022]|uniref:YncE family protein n=1 Tax=Pseudoalteromonas sp. MMG022 TaxID=2909978 RepID=UPI001F15F17F|nr:hypothetical protein [Pseudoalteromonas sp. MMG022]MCF6437761.1 hypothetical protein [Pseudoalteromonas sp. MMG022]
MTDFSIGNIELFSDKVDETVAYYTKLLGVKFDEKQFPNRMFISRDCEPMWIIHDKSSMTQSAVSESGIRIGLVKDSEWHSVAGEQSVPTKNLVAVQGRHVLHRDMCEQSDPEGNRLGLLRELSDLPQPKKNIRALKNELIRLGNFIGFAVNFYSRLHRAKALDLYEHTYRKVSYLKGDIEGYPYIMASREGLYVLNAHGYKKVLRGSFYGVTVGPDGHLYCFQNAGVNHRKQNKGRILKLELNAEKTKILRCSVCVSELHAACHQIDFIGDHLYIVDCQNGKILRTDAAVSRIEESFSPLGEMTQQEAFSGPHLNSLCAHPDGTIWLLLHNSGLKQSEIVVVDKLFQVQKRFFIDAGMAHNIVFSNDDNSYLVCDSFGGRVVSDKGEVFNVGSFMPRGIALDNKYCVVGDSCFQTRVYRRYIPGHVHFYEAGTWKKVAEMSVPAAPTEIRRIDGQDQSLSNFVTNQQAYISDDTELVNSDYPQLNA